jgi:sec-independent protein translocase protein TatA
MFGNIGFGEMMFILVVLLLLFGAKRLPEIGGSLGKGIREFKRSVNDIQGELTKTEPPQHMSQQPPVASTPVAPRAQVTQPVQPMQVQAPPRQPVSTDQQA